MIEDIYNAAYGFINEISPNSDVVTLIRIVDSVISVGTPNIHYGLCNIFYKDGSIKDFIESLK